MSDYQQNAASTQPHLVGIGENTAPAGAGAAGAQPVPALARDTTAENPWPVSKLSQAFHETVARNWPAAWIEGQISEINTRRSGSAYITLRDNTQEISIQVMGFGRFAGMARDFHQGDRVVVHGRADIWVKQTRLSFMGDDIRRVGKGDLMAQIEELRKRLKGEGLFDETNKVAFPEFPQRIGLICAPQARAEGDVITNAQLRWPTIAFTVEHVHVQGPQCPPEVIAAIQKLDADPAIDIIIVARGGGSFEDLIGFSDEGVVRATAACVTPIVSAIGHEDDWTLIDLASDLRASTPTDAAKRTVPDVMEQIALITDARTRIAFRVRSRLDAETRFIEGYANRPSLTQPLTMLDKPQRFLDDSRQHLEIGLRRILDDASLTVEKLHSSLTALSPQSTLNRGYAVVQDASGHVISSASDVEVGGLLGITLKRGAVKASVTETVDAESNH